MTSQILSIVCAVLLSASAQSAPDIDEEEVDCTEEGVDCDEEEIDFDEVLDEVDIDVQGSLSDVEERLGISVYGDMRFGYIFEGEDIQDVAFGETDVLRTRWRLRSTWGLRDGLRASV